jgi:hypothetical protein
VKRPVFLAVLLLVVLAPGARAASVLQTAWWWQPQQGALPAPPIVPSGGLLVQGLPDGPAAVAAVRVVLQPGTTSASLVLPVDSSVSAGVAQGVFLACTITGDWSPGPAQSWSDLPASDCRHALVGKATDSEVTFDLGPRTAGAVLDLAVLPGAVTAGIGSTFTAVFAPPTVRAATTAPAVQPAVPLQQPGSAPVVGAPAPAAPQLAPGAAPPAPAPALPNEPVAVAPPTSPPLAAPTAATAAARPAAAPSRVGWWLLLLGIPLVRLLWRPPVPKEAPA